MNFSSVERITVHCYLEKLLLRCEHCRITIAKLKADSSLFVNPEKGMHQIKTLQDKIQPSIIIELRES